MAANYRAQGDPRAAHRAVLWGGVGSAVLVGLALLLPDQVPAAALPAGYTAALYMIAKQLQGPTYDRHVAQGGAKASGGRAALVGVAGLLAMVVALGGVTLLMPEDRIDVGDSEVWWTEGADEAEARRVGVALRELDIVGPARPVSVQVGRKAGVLQVSFVLQDPAASADEVRKVYEELAGKLSGRLEGGRPVQILLCKGFFEPLHTVQGTAPSQ